MICKKIPKPKKLYFGTAGIPLSTKIDHKESGVISGLRRVLELNLDGMELEFVRNVFLNENSAKKVKEFVEKCKEDGKDLFLTCHGSYFINLNAKEEEKFKKSIERIYLGAKIAFLSGATSFTFHAAYYLKDSKEKVYLRVKKALIEVVSRLKKEGIFIYIRPELTGKETQFGNLDELIKISKEVEMVLPCIDFAHFNARYAGRFNKKEYYENILKRIGKELGKEVLENMHIHMSGIEYTQKGEKNHLNLKESDMPYKDILDLFKKYNLKGYVISESPNIEGDAILMKETYLKI